MPNINQLSSGPVTLQRTLGMPEGGPKCLPLTLDFSASTTYTLDYGNMQQRNFLDMCQTLWVDNFNSAQVLTITITGTNQIIQVPANTQGYFAVLCPNPIKIQFDSTGGVVCQVTLLNFPVLT